MTIPDELISNDPDNLPLISIDDLKKIIEFVEQSKEQRAIIAVKLRYGGLKLMMFDRDNLKNEFVTDLKLYNEI